MASMARGYNILMKQILKALIKFQKECNVTPVNIKAKFKADPKKKYFINTMENKALEAVIRLLKDFI